MLDLNSEMGSGYSKHGIFVIFRNNLNGFLGIFTIVPMWELEDMPKARY
jgi:hypothetical protein